jgi:hypothetical protein
VRFVPINIRPILGIRRIVHTKTISDFASANALLAKTASDSAADKTRSLLEQLEQLCLPTRTGRGWGLRFRFATRFVVADENTPNSYQTINAIHAFLDGYQALRDDRYLAVAEQGMEFEEHEMGYREIGDAIVWNYWQGLDTGVYNISGLMLGLAARMYAATGTSKYRDWSIRLQRFIAQGQNTDGSWYYSDDERGRWVDGYHTGFILEGLCRAKQAGVLADESVLRRGAEFYVEQMFAPSDIPLYYYPATLYPIDVQNAAQAIQSLAMLARMGLCDTERLKKTVVAVDEALWNDRGYYNYLKTPLFSYRTPMHRWGTGPMFLALVYAQRLLEDTHDQSRTPAI